MPDDNYPDTEDQSSPSTAADKGEESAEGATFLVPKSAVKGYEVGDTCTFKIAHLYEDEAELEPVKDEKEGGSMDSANAELDAMSSEQ